MSSGIAWIGSLYSSMSGSAEDDPRVAWLRSLRDDLAFLVLVRKYLVRGTSWGSWEQWLGGGGKVARDTVHPKIIIIRICGECVGGATKDQHTTNFFMISSINDLANAIFSICDINMDVGKLIGHVPKREVRPSRENESNACG